jgi:hypothetical protein
MFLLPFVTVSCSTDGTDSTAGSSAVASSGPVTADVSFTGVDLLTGGNPDISITAPSGDGTSETVQLANDDAADLEQQFSDYHHVQPLVVVAAALLLVCMVLTLVLPRLRSAPIAAAGALASIVLLSVQVLVVSPELAQRAYDEQGNSDALDGLAVSMHTVPAGGFYATVAVLLVVLLRQFFVARRPPIPTDLDTLDSFNSIR